VFWSDRADGSDAEELFRQIFGEDASREDAAEHAVTVDRVRSFLDAARRGLLSDRIQNPDAPFYVLGLSPNAARLNVRFWLTGTVHQFAERLARHAADLQIGGQPSDEPLMSIQAIIAETSRRGDRPSPLLAGSVARAILAGLPYFPETLLNAIVRRIRADGEVPWRRAAILKAFLKRERSFDVDVYLNKEHPEKAYHCGRLLAVLAFAQEQALGTVNSAVVRRNMGSVMAMPGLMLGRLQRAAETGHIPKLDGNLPDFLRDELKAINVRLQDDVPAQLSLRKQTLFALGFYQQLQYLDMVGKQVKAWKRFQTAEGEWVRSKLEVKVADALHRFKLDYIYEPRALLKEGERWPDFVVRRGRGKDLFIEVLGMNTPEYNDTWNIKMRAYEDFGVTPEGGPQGQLIVLDFRERKYDERVVYEALRPFFADQEDTPSPETQEPSND
jgi:CRISPR-associated protein Csd1